jgi:hypothetical protein
MDDAQALEAFDGLGGDHRGAVVGEKGARQSALVKGLRQAVDEGLGRLVRVPLQVAAESRAVVENAEGLRLLPLATGGEHGARALVEVQVPEAVHVRDLVGTRLARHEWLALGVLAMATFAGAQKPLPLHEPAHRRVAGHRPERWVLAGERDEVVVVKLEGPPRMVAVLARDRFAERGAQARMRPGVRGDLARESGEGVLRPAGDVPPSLEGLEGEADRLAGGRVAPGARRERLDAGLELAVVGGRCHQRTEDLKA